MNIFDWFKRTKAPNTQALSKDDLVVISRFAAGEASQRIAAAAAYRKARASGVALDSHPAMAFMAEVNSANPDLPVREALRKKVLRQVPV